MNKNLNPKKQQAETGISKLLWYGLGAAIVVLGLVAYFVSRSNSVPFEMTGGEDNPVVLLRNESTVHYELTFTGRSDIQLKRLVPRIQLYQGQVLVADVQGVTIRLNGQEYVLEDGAFPDDGTLILKPGDVLDVAVTYLGQELGWNRLYGWHLEYVQGGRSIESNVKLKENEQDYYVFVE